MNTFSDAIERVAKFTRPIQTITRTYGSTVVEPGAATLFFVNEHGTAVTCKHVAEIVLQADAVNQQYQKFVEEKKKLPMSGKYNRKLRELEQKYGYKAGVTSQIKNIFVDCVDTFAGAEAFLHPTADVAILQFKGFSKLLYEGYASFKKSSSTIRQGDAFCRLGYPFPEFSNFQYNASGDDIEWTSAGKPNTPRFPTDGIVTRFLLGATGTKEGIEMSTPGLRGQSGGPLFDASGIIYGMQSQTKHLHLGFDIKDQEIFANGKKIIVSNHPFLHLGACVHLDVIKAFLAEKSIKYYETD